MPTKAKTSSDKDPAKAIRNMASKAAKARTARAGDIVLHLTGERGATYRVSTRRGKAEVFETMDTEEQPLFEVTGDADTIRAIFEGDADAREEFLAGGIRVRGDLQHLSDLAVELEILEQPL